MIKDSVLVRFINEPKSIKDYSLVEINFLLKQSYVTGLTARIFYILQNNELLGYIPNYLQWHFISADKVFRAYKQDVQQEIAKIIQALRPAGITPVFLKGAAYIACDSACHQGRLFSDIDVFVKKADINATEKMLHWNGWVSEELDEHDQKYYRNWMHEIPPMVNSRTNMTIDVHHNLVPLTSKIKLNSIELLDNVIESDNKILTLSPEDKILHSAAHLLLDSEFNNGFRDIHDLNIQLKENELSTPNFHNSLLLRAEQLGFDLILYYCLMLQKHIFHLDVPDKVIDKLEDKLSPSMITSLVLKLFIYVLIPNNSNSSNYQVTMSSFALFIRSHWLKMPIHILIPHLLHKTFITPFTKWKKNKKVLEETLNG